MYEKLLTEAEQAIVTDREKQTMESIKGKLKKKQQLQEDIAELDHEIAQLVKEGKIKDLSTYIKITDGTTTGNNIV